MTDPAAARGTYAAAPQPAKVRVDLDDAAYNVVLDVARMRRRALTHLDLWGSATCPAANAYGCKTENVSHFRGSPAARPRLNHRIRCAGVPCVETSPNV